MQKRTAPQDKDSKQNKTARSQTEQTAAPAPEETQPQKEEAQAQPQAAAAKAEDKSEDVKVENKAPEVQKQVEDKSEPKEDKAEEKAAEPQKAPEPAPQAAPAPAQNAQSAPATPLSMEQFRSLEQDKAISSLKGRTSMLTALSVLILLGLGGGAFYGYDSLNNLKAENQALKQTLSGYEQDIGQVNQARQDLITSQAQIESLANQNRSLIQANASMKDQTDAVTARLNELIQKDAQVKADLGKVNARLDEFEGRNPDDWRIAQSYFCINQAYSRAVYGRDIKAALWNLKQGDLVLVNIEDEEVLKIRRAIASDIAALERLPTLDLFGTRAKIEALIESTDKLTLQGYMDDFERSEAFSSGAAPSSDFTQWKENLITSVKEFSSRFVEVRRKSPDEESDFISPTQDQFLRANIKSRLLMALQAVDNQDEKAYTSCLNEVVRMVNAYFDPEKASTAAFVAGAGELLATPIIVSIPDTLQSYALFNGLMQERLQRGDQ